MCAAQGPRATRALPARWTSLPTSSRRATGPPVPQSSGTSSSPRTRRDGFSRLWTNSATNARAPREMGSVCGSSSRHSERQMTGERPRSGMTMRRSVMTLRINSEAPNFTAETTEGKIDFHQWIGNGWAILFSHPKDFTPVCTTELGYMARLQPEFEQCNCKIIGLSVDPVSNHARWADDIEETQGHAVNYPMIGDPELKVAKLYDMLPDDAGVSSEGRTAADNAPVRAVFFISPDKKIKAMLTYPMTSGRNFDEVLRLLDSLQLTSAQPVATPVNWTQGDDAIIVPSVSDAQAREKFPGGWKAPKPYLRIVPQPHF